MRLIKHMLVALVLMGCTLPVTAQIRTIDPTSAAQNDAVPPPGERGTEVTQPARTERPAPAEKPASAERADDEPVVDTPAGTPPASALATKPLPTFRRDDLIGAAEGVFGKGAAGLGGIIERVLADQGEPNAYIVGREAAFAVAVGVRYGSGTMRHKVEGERPVYWTGPSIGFDLGGDAANVFTLVYNLYDSQDLYKRYPQAEGRAYFVGGFSASYLHRDDVVLIPVRLGVGVRLGVNIGYMKFTETSRWFPL